MLSRDYGALYESTDTSSLTGQGTFLRCTRLRLVGLTVAAMGGAITAEVRRVDVFGVLALLAFVVALGAEVWVLSAKPERTWYEGRAAAESVKTLAWRFMMVSDPFGPSVSDADASKIYLTRLRDVLSDLRDIDASPILSAERQITAKMLSTRASDLSNRKARYDQDRIEEQRSWYASKSAQNGRQATRWSATAIALELVGILAATLKAFQFTTVDALGIVAAAAAGAAAWAQAKQFRTLNRAYFVASQELASIRSQIDNPMTPEEWNRFVQDSEEAVSREHTLWRASRGVAQKTL